MKGIILAGGAGTRLYPASLPVSKILLPIYDKPMIYYPLSTLIQAGIRDILVITAPSDAAAFEKLLGDGSRFGVNIYFKNQYVQRGIADAFIIGEDFIRNDDVALILGDNVFYGDNIEAVFERARAQKSGATVFAYKVKDPERFGVVEFDETGRAVSLEEKPKNPKSDYAVTGLYFYDNKVVEYAKSLKPSARGELEITDLNKIYLKNNELIALILDESYEWLDTGTHDSLLEAGNIVKNLQQKLGVKIASPENIAYKKGFLDKKVLENSVEKYYKNNDYYAFLKKVAEG